MSEKIEVRHVGSESKIHPSHVKEHLKRAEAGRAEKAAEHLHSDTRHEQESARHEVHEQALSGAEREDSPSEGAVQKTVPHTKETKEHAFNSTMHHVRRNLSRPERQFSKFIHQPAVEKTSEVLGKTVARPSGMIGATVAAFIGLLSVYSIAKFAGFQLSGSEMPLLLLIGFTAGLLIEWGYKAARSIFLRRNA